MNPVFYTCLILACMAIVTLFVVTLALILILMMLAWVIDILNKLRSRYDS